MPLPASTRKRAAVDWNKIRAVPAAERDALPEQRYRSFRLTKVFPSPHAALELQDADFTAMAVSRKSRYHPNLLENCDGNRPV